MKLGITKYQNHADKNRCVHALKTGYIELFPSRGRQSLGTDVLGRWISTRRVISAGLVLVALLGLASAVLYNYFPGIGYLISPTKVSPTATYTGQMGVSFQGIYHYLAAVPKCRHSLIPCSAPDEVVFYLETNATVIRLIFYCGIAPEFCTRADQLPFSDGAVIYVKGTLIEPSKWPASQFEPFINFSADLYVFQHNEISESTASFLAESLSP